MRNNLQPREYQKNIANSVSSENSIIALPTGLGKTVIALIVAENRLKIHPEGKIVLLAPTKPLVFQHASFFTNNGIHCDVLTGEELPDSRSKLWESSQIISATPQTVLNDVKSGRVHLKNFVLSVFDEAHRCIKDYSYTALADFYMKQSLNPLILGLTASPGGSKSRIEEIASNLFASKIESRSESDIDVKPYVEDIDINKIVVVLPVEVQDISNQLKELLDEKIKKLVALKIIFSPYRSKRILLDARQKILQRLKSNKNQPYLYGALVNQSQAIIIYHAIELAESQGLVSLSKYFERQVNSSTKSAKGLNSDIRWISVKEKTAKYLPIVQNPKIEFLIKILSEQKYGKAIIFTQYRDTLNDIIENLKNKQFKVGKFVGQANRDSDKGLNQKMQKETIRSFENGDFNILVSSSIGEEGLHIPDVDIVIFYEAVPSEIRSIQRRGRTGRTSSGKVFILLAKDTIDESYYYSSVSKEKKMRRIVSKIDLPPVKKTNKDTLLYYM